MTTLSEHMYAELIRTTREAQNAGTVIAIVTGKSATATEVIERLLAEGLTVTGLGALTPLEYQRTLERVSAAQVSALVVSSAMWATWKAPSSIKSAAYLEPSHDKLQALQRIKATANRHGTPAPASFHIWPQNDHGTTYFNVNTVAAAQSFERELQRKADRLRVAHAPAGNAMNTAAARVQHFLDA